MEQLLLFQDVQIKITYWAHPFDKDGMYVRNVMELCEEIVPEHRLKDMLWQLEICECVNVKWQPIK